MRRLDGVRARDRAHWSLGVGALGSALGGGLVALGAVTVRGWRESDPRLLRLNLDLCSMYWDFLLLMWLVLFGLLSLT